jgi:hypothetical protein
MYSLHPRAHLPLHPLRKGTGFFFLRFAGKKKWSVFKVEFIDGFVDVFCFYTCAGHTFFAVQFFAFKSGPGEYEFV